jgi:hypothetical protein
MVTTGTERYWRIRMKCDEDLTSEAWQNDEIGIWYGAWTAEEFLIAEKESNPAKYLSELPHQKNLRWDDDIHKASFDTAKRFANIGLTDWVFTYFDNALHLARVCGGIKSRPEHKLNRGGQLFKYRPITEKKMFRLDHLPDCFQLLSTAGRGNVHEVNGTNWELIKILANNSNDEQVTSEIQNKPLKEWLDILGPTSWESICFGYLILKEDFLPTGLTIGHTLARFDIIGRTKKGQRVFAQCKKDLMPKPVDGRFVTAIQRDSENEIKYYYFAYGGCIDPVPPGVRTLSRTDFENWFQNQNDPSGIAYLRLLRGIGS